jgi:histidyl-tRNA synthetase
VAAFIADPENARAALAPVLYDLAARGMADWVTPDLSIVRGLAYYTGTVFEVFDAAGEMRAVAGGGRYDNLLSVISDGKVDLPAIGFAMGNIVVLDLINQTGEPKMRLDAWLQRQSAADVFVIIADESKRPEALATVQQLRSAGFSTDYPLGAARFNKQFQAADAARATVAVIIGTEYPDLSVKHLSSRREIKATPGTLLPTVKELLDGPPGPLIA